MATAPFLLFQPCPSTNRRQTLITAVRSPPKPSLRLLSLLRRRDTSALSSSHTSTLKRASERRHRFLAGAGRMESSSSGGGGFWTKRTLLGVGLGQVVSLLITSTGFSSSELSRRGINVPTSQSFLNYALLAVVYGALLIYRRRSIQFQMKWYYYLLLAFVDVEANFLVVKAYQYTSLTSVMLLDCWTIPSVIFLTWLFLKTKYGFGKLAGVATCVAGLILVVFSDVHSTDRGGGSNPLKGDMLVIVGAMLYAVANVGEEFLVKKGDRTELMAMLGLFGAIVSACQISIFERQELISIHWNSGAVLPFLGYALAMFLFYSTVPVLLKKSGSTMLNLSLLTSDMWAVLIRIFVYREKVDLMYFIAFAAVTVGILIYSGGAKEENEDNAQVNEDADAQDKDGDEEALGNNIQGSSGSDMARQVGKGPHYSLIRDEQ